MKRIITLAVALLFAAGCATSSGKLGDVPMVNTDHCTTGLKQTVPVNFSSATTTSLIAPVAGANVYICAYSIEMVQNATTAQNFQLEYGTGSTCGTGTTVLANWWGNITASTPAPITMNANNFGATHIATANADALVPSQRICGVTTQSSTVTGFLTYVQE